MRVRDRSSKKKPNKTCKQCGSEFYTSDKRDVYCGSKCYGLATRGPRADHFCCFCSRHCFSVDWNYRHQACKECVEFNKASKAVVLNANRIRKCSCCGSGFTAGACRRQGVRRFCSVNCERKSGTKRKECTSTPESMLALRVGIVSIAAADEYTQSIVVRKAACRARKRLVRAARENHASMSWQYRIKVKLNANAIRKRGLGQHDPGTTVHRNRQLLKTRGVKTWMSQARNKQRNIRGRKMKDDKGKIASASEIVAQLEKDNYKCFLTGWDLDIDNFSIDHLVPVCQGGTNEIDNLRCVVPDANRAKGAVSLKRFIEICCAVAARHGGMVMGEADPEAAAGGCGG